MDLAEESNPLEGFDVRPSADDENMMELADDSVQGFFDHRGKNGIWNAIVLPLLIKLTWPCY